MLIHPTKTLEPRCLHSRAFFACSQLDSFFCFFLLLFVASLTVTEALKNFNTHTFIYLNTLQKHIKISITVLKQ